MSARDMMAKAGVTLICTTDDPVDSLKWHKEIAKDDDFKVQTLPAFRPDRTMNLEKKDYLDYLIKTINIIKKYNYDIGKWESCNSK